MATSKGRCALAALSGVLGAGAFLSAKLSTLILIALVPLLVAIPNDRPPRPAALFGLWLGWLMGVTGHALAFWWLVPTIARFEDISAAGSLPFFALFVIYYGFQFALFALGAAWVVTSLRRASPLILGATAAGWWTLLEWGFPKIIPWSLGDALAASSLLRQAADLGGVHGLSFLIVLVNALLAAAIRESERGFSGQLRPIFIAALVLVVWSGYGFTRQRFLEGEQLVLRDALEVAVVQGGLESGRTDLAEANEEAWSIYARLTREVSGERIGELGAGGVGGKPDLIVWPETVLRLYLRSDALYRHRVARLANQLGRPLLLGSLDLPVGREGELNSAYLLHPRRSGAFASSRHDDLPTSGLEVYHKLTLLPFGEYVPGTQWLPALERWRTTGRFVNGSDPHLRLLRLVRNGNLDGAPAGIPFAPSICFETIWPGWFNAAVREGAQFLVNITDDGWFGDTAAARQHLNAAILRAVETRRWLVRASNSGISAVVDPSGRVVESLAFNAVGAMRQRIEPSERVTLYVRAGNWPVALSLLLVIAAAARAMRSPG
jgi:apolipoprotein N-acyltransferase